MTATILALATFPSFDVKRFSAITMKIGWKSLNFTKQRKFAKKRWVDAF